MTYKKQYLLLLFCNLQSLVFACASMPVTEKPQFDQLYYRKTVLFKPEQPGSSPKLELNFSLLKMMYPAEQVEFLNKILYSGTGPGAYKDRVIKEQQENYLKTLSDLENYFSKNMDITNMATSNWLYTENVILKSPQNNGIVIERELETYSGGAHGMRYKQYYVIDLESLKRIGIDDMFRDYQGDNVRAIVYRELRRYSGLNEDQPLSEGIFFDDAPELTSNFYVTERGLGLHWNPYEIAPYSEGYIDIILPWRTIRPQMLHSGMELMTKFKIYLFV
jgi:hypothetical protein